jgi:NAD(P)-dependent dehydrogenase (short-subunit alcohol dehydrogenase family)
MSVLDSLFGLSGRVALVTGGSSGLGRTIAEALAGAGAALVLVARRRDALEEVAAGITGAGGRAAVVAADLADRRDVGVCAREGTAAFGAPDILVNAAGINIRRPMLDLGLDDWDATMAVNLTAPFLLAQALVPAMIARGWGRIVNVTSLQAIRAFADSGAYGASKGGLAQLTRAQAEAWSRLGVNSNAIAPGVFRTPLNERLFADPARAGALAGRTMIGRNGELPDIRGAALFLASPASDYVTGQTIVVDGGFSVA